MNLEEFRTFAAAVCAECFAPDAGPTPVDAAITRLRPAIAEDSRLQELQYRALRDMVENAARKQDAPYGLFVALHDHLLRDGPFRPPLRGTRDLLLFDEGFYLALHEDVAAAVAADVYVDGFDHFVRCGAIEGRRPHPWRASLRLASPAPQRSPAEAVASLPGERRLETNGQHGSVRALPRPLGINLIGFHSANLGLGVSARHYYRFLVEAGLDVCPIEVPLRGGRSGHDTSYADQWLPLDEPAPHAVNLFVMNPKDIADQLAHCHPAVGLAGRINVALPFWELPRLPPSWCEHLRRMDVVVAPSDFLKYAMLLDVAGPVVRELAHPLYVPAGVAPDRPRFGIAADRVAFVCSFEMASDINRKNPFAAIEAFERAFAGDGGAELIVKVNNPHWDPGFEPHLQRLRDVARRWPNIRILDQVLPYRDVMALFASCDALVSLHRAEGLGLVMMEAMTLGKPVIATAWSGNMAFTTEANSCLVGYDLVPVQNSTQAAYARGALAEGTRWADARLEEAAHWMRRLAADRALRERIGARAAADMAAYQRRIDATELVEAIRNVAERRGVALP